MLGVEKGSGHHFRCSAHLMHVDERSQPAGSAKHRVQRYRAAVSSEFDSTNGGRPTVPQESFTSETIEPLSSCFECAPWVSNPEPMD